MKLKMQKPQPGKAEGLARQKPEKDSIDVNHSSCYPFTQSQNGQKKYSRYYYNTALAGAIKNRRFTDALNILENSGYVGDTALFMLAYIQGGVRNA